MGKIVPLRLPRRASKWTKAQAYRPRQHPAASRPRRAGARWFPLALVTLPLAAFSAVLLMPLGDGPQEAAASGAPLAATDWRGADAAALDAAQPDVAAARPASGQGTGDSEAARFSLCSGGSRVTCVVDGDTIWYQGEKIRIADLDTPEVSKPGCANEAAMGRKATLRLQALLNAGPFSLEPNTFGPSEDKYGRSLKRVMRGGESIGAILVAEGLAEEWGGPRKAWC